jgi:hypothetical protein
LISASIVCGEAAEFWGESSETTTWLRVDISKVSMFILQNSHNPNKGPLASLYIALTKGKVRLLLSLTVPRRKETMEDLVLTWTGERDDRGEKDAGQPVW